MGQRKERDVWWWLEVEEGREGIDQRDEQRLRMN